MDECCCAFENNGRFLALLTPDGRLKVWDCTNGSLKLEYTPPSHLSATCSCLQWSRTSRVLASHKKKKQRTSRHSSSSSLGLIALGTSSGDLFIYDVAAGEVKQKFEGGHENRVNDISWLEDDGLLYSCSDDKHITEWNLRTQEIKCKWKADKHGVKSISTSSHRNVILSAGRSIKLWDLEKKEMLKKFTGHATPVTQLLFLPSPSSPDSNGNVVSESLVNGQYLLSGAEQDRLLNIWYVDMDSHDKNALASLSLTDEPIAVDVLRHDSKLIHVAVVSKDGQVHIFEQSLNGGRKKPLTPTRSIQLASSGKEASPVAVHCAQLTADKEPSLLIAYGSTAKPQFETLVYSSFERHSCLIREDTTSLLLKETQSQSTQVNKAQHTTSNATNLGPANMVLATPFVGAEGGQRRKTCETSTTAEEREAQSIEDRLKAITVPAAESQTRHGKRPAPSAGSLSQMLVQALHSQDNALMETVLRSGGKETVIKNTVKRLPVNLVIPFLTELVHRIQASPGRGPHLVQWIKTILSIHMAYLMTVPSLVQSLSGLYTMMESRVGVYSKLCKLQGRLDLMLSQIATQSQSGIDEDELAEPLVVYQEEDSEEEEIIHVEDEMALAGGKQTDSDENWEEEMDAEDSIVSDSEAEESSENEEDEELPSDEDEK